ncbi:MAG: hypothetical protein IJK97_04360 [Thermoguttaceae bacterium]|nr:hypothetical protein [Thermoguttaceae bacterium]
MVKPEKTISCPPSTRRSILEKTTEAAKGAQILQIDADETDWILFFILFASFAFFAA